MAREEELLPLPPSQKNSCPCSPLFNLDRVWLSAPERGSLHTQQIVISRNIFPPSRKTLRQIHFLESCLLCVCVLFSRACTHRVMAGLRKQCTFFHGRSRRLENAFSGIPSEFTWRVGGFTQFYGVIRDKKGSGVCVTRWETPDTLGPGGGFCTVLVAEDPSKGLLWPRGWVGLKSINLRPANIVFKPRIFNIF